MLLAQWVANAQTDFAGVALELNAKAINYLEHDNLSLAKENIDKALALIPVIPSVAEKGLINSSAGGIYEKNGDYINALRYYHQALDCFEKLGDSLSISSVNHQVALIYFNLQAFTKALEFFEKAIASRTRKEITSGFLAIINEYRASSYFNLKEFEKAENLYQELYSYYSLHGVDEESIKSLYNIAIAQEKQRKYDEAVVNYKILYGIYLSRQDVVRVVESLNNIGYCYVLQGNYEEARKSFQNAEKRIGGDSFTKDFEASLLTNIGVCYQNSGEKAKTIEYLLRALKIRETLKDFEEIALVNKLIALAYFRSNDLYNALEYSDDAVNAARKTNNKELLSQTYNTYSSILQAAEDYQKALDYYKQFLFLQDSLMRIERKKREELDERILNLEKSEKELKLRLAEENVKDILLEQLQLKAIQREQENEILKKEKELQESQRERVEQSLLLVKQQNEALIRNRAIEVLEREKDIKDKELKLKEAQEKEQSKAIELLKTEKEMQTLEIQKQELILEKQAERAKRFVWMMALAAVIILLVVLFLFDSKRKNRILFNQKKEIEQKNEELNTQKEEIQAQAEHLMNVNSLLVEKNTKIEQQAGQIISSIQYAKRIQDAVLPQAESMSELNPSHFVLFRPRNIVSGDFYWLKQVQNFVYIAVADCTGHGVPGGFMSMLGTAFLNEITGKGDAMLPADILNALREKVKRSLRQVGKSGEAKDGMDMVLIMIDLESKELTFSGAYNSIVHIRANEQEGQPEVNHLKGDRMPIGISLKECSFTNKTLELVPNDMIYLFTDGYIDQVGGPKRSKFMTRNFVGLLQLIFNKPTDEQKEILEENLTEWMADNDQIDDILVVGIRFTDTYGEVSLF